jgi:hypothetical protein
VAERPSNPVAGPPFGQWRRGIASATTALPVLAGNRAGRVCYSGGRDERGRRCTGCGSNATIDSTPVTCRNSPYSSG